MKLSELQAIDKDKIEPHYTGIELDIQSLAPIPGIKSIGFIYGPDSDIEGDFIDTVVQYSRQAEVMLEIPADVDIAPPAHSLPSSGQLSQVARYLLSVSRNTRFAISLLPPKETDSAEVFDKYKQRLADFTAAYLASPNHNQLVYPISSFLEYLFVEHWGVTPDKMGGLDDYMADAFATKVGKAYEDEIKALMRECVYSHFGGKEGFNCVAKAMLRGLGKEVISMAKGAGDDMGRQMEANMARDGFVFDSVQEKWVRSESAAVVPSSGN